MQANHIESELARLSRRVLIVPGLYGSGPDHWQSHWESRFPSFRRVSQRDWNSPSCDDWVDSLDAAIAAANDQVIVVGHSLGAVTIALWAARRKRKIVGALLVAPSDTESETFPPCTSGFAPMPTTHLPFRSLLVASTRDPYMSFQRAEGFAELWGSEFISIGAHGHISAPDGFGPWPEGLEYLAVLMSGNQ